MSQMAGVENARKVVPLTKKGQCSRYTQSCFNKEEGKIYRIIAKVHLNIKTSPGFLCTHGFAPVCIHALILISSLDISSELHLYFLPKDQVTSWVLGVSVISNSYSKLTFSSSSQNPGD